jgi:hypothetical protein
LGARSEGQQPCKRAEFRGGERLDRTQEVGGASPPSSTPGTPATAGVLAFRRSIGARGILATRAATTAQTCQNSRCRSASPGRNRRRDPSIRPFDEGPRMMRSRIISACFAHLATCLHRRAASGSRRQSIAHAAGTGGASCSCGQRGRSRHSPSRVKRRAKRVRLFDRVVEGVVGVLARRPELSGKRRLPRLRGPETAARSPRRSCA